MNRPPQAQATHVVTGDGRRYCIRHARPEDEPALARMLADLTPGEVRLRFFAAAHPDGPRWTAPLLRDDARQHLSWVATPVDLPGEIAGNALLVTGPAGADAEFAILVHHAHAGRGLGRALLQHLLDGARARNIPRVYGLVLAENATMRDLVRRLGFSQQPDPDEPGCVRAEIATDGTLPPPRSAQASGQHSHE